VGRGSVTSGKCFSRDNEGSCVGTEILEEVGEAVQEYKGFGRSCRSDEVLVGETFQAVSRRQRESIRNTLPMITKRAVSTTKPMSWIGFLPHESMKRSETQNPEKPCNTKNQVPDTNILQI
jgi:hypothetical protein